MSVLRHRYLLRPLGCTAALIVLASFVPIHSSTVEAHPFVPKFFRVGAYPQYNGSGWQAEVFMNIPNYDLAHLADLSGCMNGPGQPISAGCKRADLDGDGDVDLKDLWRLERDYFRASLIQTERYVNGLLPDFTFTTAWIDFPSGPQAFDTDASFRTMGDFFDDYVLDISDPAMLDEPFGSFYVRFSGYVKVRPEDEIRTQTFSDLPVWVTYGTMGYDGYRVSVGTTIYRIANVNWNGQPFFQSGPGIEAFGLFPIEVGYFNSFDRTGEMGNPQAGIELYSWHGGGLAWPAGAQMIHEVKGPGTLVPPRLIYQAHDIRPLDLGDFDADTDVDLRDYSWFLDCFNGDMGYVSIGCDDVDFDGDGKVFLNDLVEFQSIFFGPRVPVSALQIP